MKSRGIKFALGLLALALGGLAVSSHAQQPKVKFAFKDITVPTAVETNAFGINNKKEIVGDYINQAGAQEALFLKGSKLTKVACPSGGSPTLYGVNSGGSAVSDDYCGNGVVWTYVPGVGMRPVPNPGCPDCPFFSLAINDSEVVAGMFQNEQQQLQGFTLDTGSGEFTAWDLPGGPTPQPALGMNNAGAIVLSAADPASGLAHSYLFDGKSFMQIDVPGALQSFAHGINNNGDIVYTVEDSNGNNWGVFFYATLREFYWFNQPDGRDNTRGYGLNDEVQTKTGVKLEIVGTYLLPGSTLNQAYEATVTIKP
ncbi:MAG: hypothetical protein WBV36_13460 [Terriglobales bacterium]